MGCLVEKYFFCLNLINCSKSECLIFTKINKLEVPQKRRPQPQIRFEIFNQNFSLSILYIDKRLNYCVFDNIHITKSKEIKRKT